MRRVLGLTLLAVACLTAATAGAPMAGQARGARGTPPADPNEWSIDSPHSSAGFAVRHMLVSTVRGKLGPVTGKIWYDGTNVSSIRAEATIDVKGISTGDNARDADLRGADFFDVATHPNITFKSKRVVPGDAGQFSLVGDLTIRGTTKEVTLKVEGPSPIVKAQNVSRCGATATVTINRFDYGLQWNRLIEVGGGAVVSADVVITVDLEITKR